MTAWTLLALAWLIAALMMSLGWQWQRAHRNAGIVDVLWAAGVGGSAILFAILGDGDIRVRLILGICGGAWGLRLAYHLWRRVRGESEDGRYRHLRAHWRDSQVRFFGFFQLQALLIVLFALPFVAVARNRQPSTPWVVLGIAIWIASVAGEALADRQLARFRADPANHGKTCRAGLWAYSRHPNYFFEAVHWLAYCAFAIGSPIAWLALSGPLLMFAFLRWVSGIPYTEAQALRTRGEDYRAYQRSTSMLIPWFRKKPR